MEDYNKKLALYVMGHGTLSDSAPSYLVEAAQASRELYVALFSENATIKDLAEAIAKKHKAARNFRMLEGIDWPL